MKRSVNLISLGCSKNLVDSERLIKMLECEGFDVTFESDEFASIVIINTCGFIGDAKQESIDNILYWAEHKCRGKIDKLIVMGCLSQRYGKELAAEIEEVDFWVGKHDWPQIVTYLTGKAAEESDDRVLTTPKHYTYIKIAEGCNKFCAFCAIPLITGRFKSRPIEKIVAEVESLVARGVSEFNIIAQDLSDYGKDIYGHCALAELIDRISDVKGVKWVRLHYLYPSDFPYDLLDVMARKDNVCKYMDIALQHTSDKVLTNMRRHITAAETRELLAEIRRRVPGIHLRTTLMVGFPGEDEEAYEELLEFVRQERFERMGAFTYCEEEDTYAAKHFEDSIPQDVKDARLDKLMALQEEIALECQQAKVGTTLHVVVDGTEGDYFVCRSEYDSPEVDPVILVKVDDEHSIGEMYDVKIVTAEPFELIGEFI